MSCRQSPPEQWLIVNEPDERGLMKRLRRLPTGSGILVLGQLSAAKVRRLRMLARLRRLIVAFDYSGDAVRVHGVGELRSALLRRSPLIFLSPLFATRSHPDWVPLHHMRAATLARLGGRNLGALGGMDVRRFARIKRLGFKSWAGISAFRN